MSLHVERLESRDCPSGIPDWTGQTSRIAIPPYTLYAAGVLGGPRVILTDGDDRPIWDQYLGAEELFRGGVNVAVSQDRVYVGYNKTGGPRIDVADLATGRLIDSFFVGDPAIRDGISVIAWLRTQDLPPASPGVAKPAVPLDVDPAANSVESAAGTPTQQYFDRDTFKLVDNGPQVYGVALVFDTPPDGTTADLQARIYLPTDVQYAIYRAGRGVDDLYLAVGLEGIGRARECVYRYTVLVSGPASQWDVTSISQEVLTWLDSLGSR